MASEMTFSIPKTCKAGVVLNEGPDFTVVVEEVPVPEPAHDELLVRLNVTGICYTDIHFMAGDLGAARMSHFGVRSPGHEGAGVVVKMGENVKGWKVGDRAGVKPLMDVCLDCEHCWGGKETYCLRRTTTGLMRTGTYQQFITCAARYTTRIPDGVDDYIAAPIMCSASTIYRSIKESGLQAGDWAVFPGGGGGVGIQGVQLAKAMGLRVIAIDTGVEKKDLVLKMGAEAFIDFKETGNVAETVLALTNNLGAHAVFVTAGPAYKTAAELVGQRVGAKIMCIGMPPNSSDIFGVNPMHYVYKNLTITGTLVGSMKDTSDALDFAKRGLLKPMFEIFPIDRLPEAVQKLKSGQAVGRLIVDFNA